jgi:hypothetical protein
MLRAWVAQGGVAGGEELYKMFIADGILLS